ncbi:hypothetical protein [Kiloniella sp. b19]|uniref:hypothetical protein n=1 Tax=Kiloniella sp. GXU_MW_B19 TaxID=3141326 RepID=UPI0031D8103A
MSLGLREARKRRSQKFRRTLFKWLMALAFIGAAGTFAYLSGEDLAKRQVQRLEETVDQQKQDIAALHEERSGLNAKLAEMDSKAQEWEERYDRDVPKGELKTIMDTVIARLDEGVAADRVTFLVSSASKERACDNNPEDKRFFVNTPFFSGANDSVSFASGGVLITASGQSATNAEGKVEAWFDPAQPVKIVFTLLGGKTEVIEGKLPLHKSVVVSGNEYRFSLVQGSRGFANITGDRCDYP